MQETSFAVGPENSPLLPRHGRVHSLGEPGKKYIDAALFTAEHRQLADAWAVRERVQTVAAMSGRT